MILPDPDEVLVGVEFGEDGEFTGTLALPAAGHVRRGVQYGGDGTEFTGTLRVAPSGTSDMFDNTCDILRRPFVSGGDEHGQQSADHAPHLADVSCALRRGRPREVVIDQIVTVTDWVLFLPYGTDIAVSDRVMIGAAVFNVLGVVDAAGRGHHLECPVEAYAA